MCHIGHPWPVRPLGVAARRLLLAHLFCIRIKLLSLICQLLNCPSRNKGLETSALVPLWRLWCSATSFRFLLNLFVCLLTGEETPMPEWVQRELSHAGVWHPSVLEAWYPASNACGASSDLMESFRYFSETCLWIIIKDFCFLLREYGCSIA